VAAFVVGSDDGHTRITRGPGFAVEGGSQEQHDFATDVAQEAAKEASGAGTVEDAKRAAVEVIVRRSRERSR